MPFDCSSSCSLLFYYFYNTSEKIREVWISNDFLKFIYIISIEFWIRNTLLHKFFQTDMIFFDQFKVPVIQFGKCFAEFYILFVVTAAGVVLCGSPKKQPCTSSIVQFIFFFLVL